MKIAMATSFPQEPESPHGGVEAVSVNLVRALAKLEGLEVHVVTTDKTGREASQTTWQGATVHRLPWAGGKTLAHATGPGRRQMADFLARLQPDVVHAHDTYGLMVRGLALPRVFTVHGFIHEDTRFQRGGLAWLRWRLWRRAELAGWADQRHIISISPYVRERLRGLTGATIHDIDNPVDEKVFGLKRDDGGAVIFSAALICARKNTLGLLRSLAKLVAGGVEARLRLAGTASDPEYERQVRDFIRTAGLAERVALMGAISRDQIREELSRASVFALVSLEEGAPMGVAEAMAAGVPVVTSNRCGMPYMVRDGETGFLVDPNNSDDIASRLRTLLENGALRKQLGDKGREIAFDRFHPDRVARRTYDVYSRAIRDWQGNGEHGRSSR
jgi:glycosyltransferase involved in cell wall biosynthesis